MVKDYGVVSGRGDAYGGRFPKEGREEHGGVIVVQYKNNKVISLQN